ncbi:Putative DnaJ domain, Chaperone J-domain superfamily [Septoria linicola]|uniref:DnaJ domain, Chaperone J-domain superfamily n=1 Tax=Septoria linicola TaxID=215465 RepID=A0A9Q9AXM1_9PEZI|nr:Putative DnaJ domain, Chaperone J-domain superfamily [Septoria linicola]
MVKPDLKHNYYQDLDLPTTASVDDVRKAYRKLALQFHPDRNAGREEECVPRFQAIQAANEILSDPTSKAKYDADRRKVGLYPSFSKPSAPAAGNPYAARSDFPPPPRRTQPGTWQRPGAQTQPSGADRFANFARTAGSTPQKNPAADRTQQFRAWQNMKEPNTAPRPNPPEVPPRQPPPRSPQPPTPGAAPTSARPRMGRKDTQLPTEEKIRAGMRYGSSAAPSAEEAASHQSAWQASQQQKSAGQPGLSSNGQRRQPPATPKRPGGFDPNAPGSDERAAPQSSHYVHRHKSEDFGRAAYPPPPPGPPPASTSHSPTSPNMQRPFADPLRPFKSRASNEDAPYAEANRTSTPYSSYSGEKTAFAAEGIRRSASVRDTTKLSPESAKSTSSRARSVDPATRRKQATHSSPTNTTRGNGFAAGMYDSSETDDSSDDEDISGTPEEIPNPAQPSTTSLNTAEHGGPAARPLKTPKPPSRIFNRNGATPQVPPAANDGATHTDGEQPNMQQRKKSENMYGNPSFQSDSTPSSFDRANWIAKQFGTGKAKGGKPSKASVPSWAIPSSVSPSTGQSKKSIASEANRTTSTAMNVQVTASALSNTQLSDDAVALDAFRGELKRRLGHVEQLNQLDMKMFHAAICLLRDGGSTDNAEFDTCLRDVLARVPVSVATLPKKLANNAPLNNSFAFPIDGDTFKQTSGKSRSVEEINTNFSPNGFHGRFEGSGDYFTDTNSRRPSPTHRQSSRRGQRAATTDSTPLSNGTSPMKPQLHHNGSDASLPGSGAPFSQEAWQKTFSDGASFWPPPPPNPPASRVPSRKGSRVHKANGNGPTLGTAKQPHVVDDDDNVIEVDRNGRPMHGGPPADEGDAMDIDTPPQSTKMPFVDSGTPSQPPNPKEARLYSVEPSEWRQQQHSAQQQTQHHRPTSSSARRAERKSAGESSFNVSLDDLRQTEPFVQNNEGLKNLGDLGTSLPFSSKASSAVPTGKPHLSKAMIKTVPAAPEGPTRLTRTSWEAYAQNFSNYLVKFHNWNQDYLRHFDSLDRENQDCARRGCGWLLQSGDTVNGPGGFGSYRRAILEEHQSREAWSKGREVHLEALKAFEKIKDRVRALVESGNLADV